LDRIEKTECLHKVRSIIGAINDRKTAASGFGKKCEYKGKEEKSIGAVHEIGVKQDSLKTGAGEKKKRTKRVGH